MGTRVFPELKRGKAKSLSDSFPLPLLPGPPSSSCCASFGFTPRLRLSGRSPPLPPPQRASLAGHGVAAVLVPLHVTDAPDGLHLGVAGAKLVEVPVLSLLQDVLAATVSGELVAHPAVGGGRGRERERGGERERVKVGGIQNTSN